MWDLCFLPPSHFAVFIPLFLSFSFSHVCEKLLSYRPESLRTGVSCIELKLY